MSLIEVVAETEKYFIDNWTNTPLRLEGTSYEFNGAITDEYIEVRYVPSSNETIMDRKLSYGILQVYCYHKIKNQAVIIADEVKDFIGDTYLPQSVRVQHGQDVMLQELDTGFWLSVVHFEVQQE